jgi:hypothetical protein
MGGREAAEAEAEEEEEEEEEEVGAALGIMYCGP